MRKECPECGNEMKVPSGGEGPVTVTCDDCGVVFDGVRHRKIARI